MAAARQSDPAPNVAPPPLLPLLPPAACLLYPRDSPSRDSKSMDGVWQFKVSPEPGRDPDIGFREEWFSGPGLPPPTLAMPVPASYNDITLDSGLRDYVGSAWYDRTFYASSGWRDQRVLLRSHSKHK